MSAEENNEAKTNGNGNGNPNNGRAFLLQQLYVKDMSFEAPNTPQIFQESAVEPDTELNIRTSHSAIGDNQFEVILHVRVHAKRAEETIFLIELDQAGTFGIQGYAPEETATLLGTHCPSTLFPYAREAISSLIGKGGFPPLILQPINFDALFAQAQQQAGQQTQQ